MMENSVKYLFEKDSNGAYIRLIIPANFVELILDKNNNMDLRGKNDLDLTPDEIIVLKKYAYELTSRNENGITTKNKLERNILSGLYGYHSNNNINNKNSALEYINKINSMLSDYSFASDKNFVLLGRKKFIYDEINEILNGTKEVENPLYFVLGSLEEFICNNNFVYMSDGEKWEKGWEDLRNRNDLYSQKNIICLEEKNVIEDIINRIKDYIESE